MKRYNPKRKLAEGGTPAIGVPYYSVYNPQWTQLMATALDNAQKRHDAAMNVLAANKEQLLNLETDPLSQQVVLNFIDDFSNKLNDEVMTKYQGDYGRALDYVKDAVITGRANIIPLAKRAAEDYNTVRKSYETLKLQGMNPGVYRRLDSGEIVFEETPFEQFYNNSLLTYDLEKQRLNYNPLIADISKRGDYNRFIDEYVASLNNYGFNTTKEFYDEMGSPTGYTTTSQQGHTRDSFRKFLDSDKGQNWLKQTMNTFIANDPNVAREFVGEDGKIDTDLVQDYLIDAIESRLFGKTSRAEKTYRTKRDESNPIIPEYDLTTVDVNPVTRIDREAANYYEGQKPRNRVGSFFTGDSTTVNSVAERGREIAEQYPLGKSIEYPDPDSSKTLKYSSGDQPLDEPDKYEKERLVKQYEEMHQFMELFGQPLVDSGVVEVSVDGYGRKRYIIKKPDAFRVYANEAANKTESLSTTTYYSTGKNFSTDMTKNAYISSFINTEGLELDDIVNVGVNFKYTVPTVVIKRKDGTEKSAEIVNSSIAQYYQWGRDAVKLSKNLGLNPKPITGVSIPLLSGKTIVSINPGNIVYPNNDSLGERTLILVLNDGTQKEVYADDLAKYMSSIIIGMLSGGNQ